ncbi:hypothetical protein VSDG_03211 [Cytospora chrysosperma]|uniref:Uncharacterized protein n=1 Tax=Cytospora chrysosperma TaxID=252740 RepID=A0A423WAZ3_CYTCH|nr:hypothetical protein VSDG_03211 [Valsa sordida]
MEDPFQFQHVEVFAKCLSRIHTYLGRPLAKPKLYTDYFDPFNCECRVYGRLKQGKYEDLAIRAHGYLIITPSRKQTMYTMTDDAETLSGENLWGRYEQHRGQPIRAISRT